MLVVAGLAVCVGAYVFARLMTAMGTGVPVTAGGYAIAAMVACSHPAVIFAAAFVLPVSCHCSSG